VKTQRRCCGIDVHKNSVTVCVLAPAGQPRLGIKRRKFPTFTRDLRQLRRWLKNCGVTEIAMEATGQYWRPLWNLLEGEFYKLLLVNPQHIKGLNGYKTDPKDAQWIAELLDSGKLRGSWVPPRAIRELRDVTRQRVNTLEDLNRAKNRIEQLCQTGNIKVSSVATDLFGVSGRAMLKAIIEGEHDAGWMADYARGTLRGKKRELELALNGTFTDEQRWLLERELKQVEWLEIEVEVLEREIARRMEPFEAAIRRLITIPGIERRTAWTIVAEIGVDMSVFGDARHLASWAGLCPGNRESGGKRKSGRVRKANRYLKRVMCQAAWAASHTRKTYLSAFYRRMCIRKGAPKAVMALAHHMITVVFQILSRSEEYVELGGDYYDRRNQAKVAARLVARLTRLGYYIEVRTAEPGGVTAPPPFVPVQPRAQKGPAARPTAPDSIAADREVEPTMPTADPVPAKRKRGRPCKCAERGIICKHKASNEAMSLIQDTSSPARFS
jgi:transposase